MGIAWLHTILQKYNLSEKNLNQHCDNLSELDVFLASVEQRAYRTALFTTRKSQDALDVVQDTMIQLVQSYRHKTVNDWPLLFQRILQNKLMDWHRAQHKQKRFFWQSSKFDEDEDQEDLAAKMVADDLLTNPVELMVRTQKIEQLVSAIDLLPLRQRQAFLLRAWEGFDVAQTALIMECTAGSVKTHYFRAVNRLQELLVEGKVNE